MGLNRSTRPVGPGRAQEPGGVRLLRAEIARRRWWIRGWWVLTRQIRRDDGAIGRLRRRALTFLGSDCLSLVPLRRVLRQEIRHRYPERAGAAIRANLALAD